MFLTQTTSPLMRLVSTLAISGLFLAIAVPNGLATQKKATHSSKQSQERQKKAPKQKHAPKVPRPTTKPGPATKPVGPSPSIPSANTLQTPWGTVNEPQFPSQVCSELKAVLTPNANHSIDALDRDPSRSSVDTRRIQQALDNCPEGHAVKLVTGPQGESGFLSGPLSLKSHVTLWIDSGVTLYASRNPQDYDNGEGSCGTADNKKGKGCRPLLSADKTQNSAIVGFGSIDGRGGSLLTNGPNRMKRSWWDLAHLTKSQGLIQHNPRLLEITASKDFTLYQISFLNTPNFTSMFTSSQGMTAWGIKMLAPSAEYTVANYACPEELTPNKAATASCFTPDTISNTDGFDTQNSSRILLAYSYISTGDDHVSIKASGSGPVSEDVAILHNHFYYGHGMSIGSETVAGVHHLFVDDLSVDAHNSPNSIGLRIKSDPSRGGSVSDINYSNVCLRNVHRPIILDSYYSNASGSKYPSFTNIHFNGIHNLGNSNNLNEITVFSGFSSSAARNPLDVSLNNVVYDGKQPTFSRDTLRAARLHLGPGPVSFLSSLQPFASSDVQLDTHISGNGVAPVDCRSAFVPFNSILPSAPF